MYAENLSYTLFANATMAVVGFLVTFHLIPSLGNMFIKANMFGMDLNKATRLKV
jgi:hypothetical protein